MKNSRNCRENPRQIVYKFEFIAYRDADRRIEVFPTTQRPPVALLKKKPFTHLQHASQDEGTTMLPSEIAFHRQFSLFRFRRDPRRAPLESNTCFRNVINCCCMTCLL